jgi:uncharacterized protein YdaL
VLENLKSSYSTQELKEEIKNIEAELLKATRELIYLESNYRARKMEALAKIEAYEAKLKWLKSELK